MSEITTNSRTKSLDEAVSLLKGGKKRNFVESIDINIQLRLKDKQKKESLKGSIALPNAFGADKKVIAFCDGSDVDAATKAGAVAAGLDDLLEKVMGGWSEFDVVVATPSVMPKIARLGKVLGPKGLMPSPKNGTISDNVVEAVASFKAGKMNYQMEQGHGVVKVKVAQVDMGADQIKENVLAFIEEVYKSSKKLNSTNPFKKISVKATMGASIQLDLSAIIENFA